MKLRKSYGTSSPPADDVQPPPPLPLGMVGGPGSIGPEFLPFDQGVVALGLPATDLLAQQVDNGAHWFNAPRCPAREVCANGFDIGTIVLEPFEGAIKQRLPSAHTWKEIVLPAPQVRASNESRLVLAGPYVWMYLFATGIKGEVVVSQSPLHPPQLEEAVDVHLLRPLRDPAVQSTADPEEGRQWFNTHRLPVIQQAVKEDTHLRLTYPVGDPFGPLEQGEGEPVVEFYRVGRATVIMGEPWDVSPAQKHDRLVAITTEGRTKMSWTNFISIEPGPFRGA